MHRHKIEQLTGDGPDHYSTVGQGLSRARTEAQSEGMWAELERDEGLAPSVRRREVGKTWRRHSEKVLGDPAIENYAPEADPTLGLHAENALKDTGQFVQRPGRKKIPTPRPDHGTINNDPDAIHRGTHHGLGRRMDNIDLADARFSGEEALVDVYDSGDVELGPETANQLKETGCFECSEEG